MDIKSPNLVVHPHPLIGADRAVCFADFENGETIDRYIDRTKIIEPVGPVAVWHNGVRVPGKLWRRLIPKPGDQVIIRATVQGGGGGGKIVRTVAVIAIAAIAAYAAPALITAYGGSSLVGASGALTSMGLAVSAGLSAVASIAGNLLVNALLPLPTPTAPSLSRQAGYQTNETYALSGGQNTARPWQPMMLIFGRHKVVPDLASRPYTEYEGNTNYLNQAFHFGLQGDQLNLEDFRIGDTPVTDFSGVDIELSDESGALEMFPGNVDSIGGFDLNHSDGWIERTTPDNVNFIKIELAAQLYYANNNGGLDRRSAQFKAQYRKVGSPNWVDLGRPTATHYWSKVKTGYIYQWTVQGFTFDLISTNVTPTQIGYGSTVYSDHRQGQDASFGNTIAEWRWVPHPAAVGKPWRGIAPNPYSGSHLQPIIVLSGASNSPTRKSVETSVPVGKYEVRVIKLTGDVLNSRQSNKSAVNQILCYQPDTADYNGQCRMAVRVQATSQLQGQLQNFSAIAQGFCDVWDEAAQGGPRWVKKATSNPAWWFLWFARGKIKNGVRVYGAGLSDDQIDIDGIKAWANFCDEKRLTFNYVLTEATSVHSVLTKIARAGRASYSWQSGKLGVIWDQADLPVVAMIGPYNIKSGSFEVSYINDQTADNIVVNFINPKRNWELDDVRVTVPNVKNSNTTAELTLDGCTDVDMAAREANLIAASQAFHRRRVSWQMDVEGLLATRGDVVQASHDLTVWSYSGRLLSGDHSTVTLDRSVPSGGTGWLSLRSPSNRIVTLQIRSGEGDVSVLDLVDLPDDFPMPDDDQDSNPLDWAWQFDPLRTPGRRLKIVEVNPVSEDVVQFTAIDDDPQYYASENNPFEYTPPRDGLLLLGVVLSAQCYEEIFVVSEDLVKLTVEWVQTNSVGEVELNIFENGMLLDTVRTTDRSHQITTRSLSEISVFITPVSKGGLRGKTFRLDHTVKGVTEILPTVTGLQTVLRQNLTVLLWQPIVDIRPVVYEVRQGSSFVDGKTVYVGSATETYLPNNGLFHVAAKYKTSWGLVVYGPSDSLLVSGAKIVRNLLKIVNEQPDWNGVLSGGALVVGKELTLEPTGDFLDLPNVFAVSDIFYFAGAKQDGVYRTNASNVVDLGYEEQVKVDIEIEEKPFNFRSDIFSYDDIIEASDVLDGSDRRRYSVTPQIRVAGDDAKFGQWRDFVPGMINARYFDVRLVLHTDDPFIVPFISKFVWSVDVPDLIQNGVEIVVSETGESIAYQKPYHANPNVQVSIFDAQDGDRYVLSQSTKNGFYIRIFNHDIPVKRTINWIAQGY